MSDKFLPDISVGNFAMDILKSMTNDPNKFKPSLKESTLESAGAPDVSRVDVPQDFITSVTEGKVYKQKRVKIQESSEQKLSNLISKLSVLLTEARSILEECGMTGVGNIGTAPMKKKLKNRFKLRTR